MISISLFLPSCPFIVWKKYEGCLCTNICMWVVCIRPQSKGWDGLIESWSISAQNEWVMRGSWGIGRLCVVTETLICAVRDPCTKRGKARSCVQKQRGKGSLLSFQKPRCGRKEAVFLATNSSVQREGSKYCNSKWNKRKGILGMRKRRVELW